MYYPSTDNQETLKSNLPFLIQTGEKDNVTRVDAIKTCFKENANTSVQIFKDAHHGFDIQSLQNAKSLRFPPIFGKKYIFKFNQVAAQSAEKNLFEFLHNQ